MTRSVLHVAVVAALLCVGCDKIKSLLNKDAGDTGMDGGEAGVAATPDPDDTAGGTATATATTTATTTGARPPPRKNDAGADAGGTADAGGGAADAGGGAADAASGDAGAKPDAGAPADAGGGGGGKFKGVYYNAPPLQNKDSKGTVFGNYSGNQIMNAARTRDGQLTACFTTLAPPSPTTVYCYDMPYTPNGLVGIAKASATKTPPPGPHTTCVAAALSGLMLGEPKGKEPGTATVCVAEKL